MITFKTKKKPDIFIHIHILTGSTIRRHTPTHILLYTPNTYNQLYCEFKIIQVIDYNINNIVRSTTLSEY